MKRAALPIGLALVVVGGAVVFALTRSSTPSEPDAPRLAQSGDPHALPPNHPPVGSASTTLPDKPAIAWTMPDGWKELPNPSSMRLATYRPPSAPGDADETELSVVRAGGTVDANIDRWIRQFDDAGKDTRTQSIVAGFTVTTVEVSGTFLGAGMMPNAAAPPKKGWSLLGAIVETPGSLYFFKMTGPTATVHAARAAFSKMVEGITRI